MALLAVNPHAGEEGAFGEEDHLMGRVLGMLAAEGISIAGPFPADTFFRYRPRTSTSSSVPTTTRGSFPSRWCTATVA
jgi:4-hydroxythreonine-4-phosphate dehydrogenase